MVAYLRRYRPARTQYRSPRRGRPTGLVVVHTAESALDVVGEDSGAEDVARFIRSRTDPGSYHDVADSDSVVQLVEYGDEAFQDGTGSNPFALSISFACRAADWPRMTPARRAGFLAQGAAAFARQQAWLAANAHPLTPLRRVSRAASAGGAAGFISHAERDPARRTDPGPDFPWAEWFAACARAAGQIIEEDDMTPEQYRTTFVELMREAAERSTPTGRQLGDYLAAVVAPSTAALVWAAQFGPDGARQSAAQRLALAAAPGRVDLDPAVLAALIEQAAGRVRINVTTTTTDPEVP